MSAPWFDPYADVDCPGGSPHPALTEPRTKEDWRAYLTYREPRRPPLFSRAQYECLDARERDHYDRLRYTHHSSLIIARTPAVISFADRLDTIMRSNHRKPHGAKTGIVVSGPPGVGKSTAVKVAARDFENQIRAAHPEFFTGGGNDYIPVAYLLVPDTVSVKALLTRLADFYGLRLQARMTTDQIMSLVVKAIRACHTRLLVIDDLHFLDVREKEGARANNMLKGLADCTGITFVAIGVDLHRGRLFTEGNGNSRVTQTSRRYTLFRCGPYPVRSAADAATWAGLVKAFEDSLVLLDHVPGSLTAHAAYLHQRTGGSICSLALLLSQAAIEAQKCGSERIGVQDLHEVVNDVLSEHLRRRNKPGRRPRPASGQKPAPTVESEPSLRQA